MAIQFNPSAPQNNQSTAMSMKNRRAEDVANLGQAIERVVGAPGDYKKSSHYDKKGSVGLRVFIEIGKLYNYFFGKQVSGSNVDKKA